MREESFAFFQKLVDIPGPSGYEQAVQRVFREEVSRLRYMHTPNEVLSLSDVENAARLMAGFCERVTPEMDWIPL